MRTDERRRHGLAEIWGSEGGKGKRSIGATQALLGVHSTHRTRGEMCVMERYVHVKRNEKESKTDHRRCTQVFPRHLYAKAA